MNTTAADTKPARKGISPEAVIASIESAALPAPTGEPIRSLATTEQNAKIRALLKSLGIKGVSVKRSHAGWAATVSVSFAGISHACAADSWDRQHNRSDCPTCVRTIAAERKIEAIILAAFPDCGDRSDLQTDYFDYVFSVRAEQD